NLPAAQLILVDTPGIHRPRGALNEALVACTMAVVRDVDLSFFLFPADARDLQPGEVDLLRTMGAEKRPFIPVINKMDLAPASLDELPVVRRLAELLPPGTACRPISALTGAGVEELLAAAVERLPAGPPFFPPDVHTEISERFWVEEIIREKIFNFTRDEVPYSTTAQIDYFHDRGERLAIGATIYVEQPSQKGILIGRQGRMLKAIGTAARQEIESLLGVPVFLELWVAVEKKWTKNPAALKRFGYR
ncbi:MAG: GTPase Era, partial [Deltaproteobacteria bacterium]|nr:GTPase Era [Deltaproteobacteria bacterium]